MGPGTSTSSSPPPPELFPPLLFDLAEDPGQTHNLLVEGGPAVSRGGLGGGTEELVQWQMRTAERTLSGSFLDSERGLVEARDTWR